MKYKFAAKSYPIWSRWKNERGMYDVVNIGQLDYNCPF
jgi:hypothetical protein